MDEFSFLVDESLLIEASDVAIGRTRPSETIRTLNESELKSIVSGTGDGGSGNESASIVCICEGRGTQSEIGFAVFDIQGSVCHLIQYADTSNYSRTMHLLTIHPPLRIIMCSSATENHRSKLYQTLLDVFPLDSLYFLSRGDFNESKGIETIERLCVPKSLEGIMFGCAKKYYAYSAVAALFCFLENGLSMSFSSKSMKFLVKPSDGTLSLDYHTCKSLELVNNCADPKSQNCLLGVLCKCQSSMGRRLMRTSLLQPLTDLIEINERQEAIQVLLDSEIELQDLRESLKNFPDIDNFISNLVRRENGLDPKKGEDLIHRALTFKKIIGRVKVIEGTLRSISQGSTFLSSIAEVLSDQDICTFDEMISDVINEDVSYSEKTNIQHHQRFYAVKSTSNGLLEVARRTLKEIQSDIYEYVDTWSQQIDLAVDIKYQSKRGYYLSVSNAVLGDRSLEGICSQYKRGRSEVTFTTMDLIKLNGRVKESMTEVLLASQTVLEGLIDGIRGKIEFIYEMSAAVSRLDFICGLAQWALESGSVCRPEFSCSDQKNFNSSLTIRQSRHPILELNGRNIVANDYFSCRGNSFIVITGANMSGKSTYSKQLALLCIMAQMGSFVPAEYASFPIYDRILTRLGSDDELESNASSFRMEMKEAAYILEMMNDSALVIIDELGRGTEYLEGLSLAMSICDKILTSEATVMFVTHFNQLVSYLKLHPKVSLLHLKSEISSINQELRFLYLATSGVVDIEDYGMKLAARSGLPLELMKLAKDALEIIKKTQGEGIESAGLRTSLQRRKMILKTAEKIKFIIESGKIDETVKGEMLKRIKEDFEKELEDTDTDTVAVAVE